MNKSMQRILAVMRKEVIHLRRDWHTFSVMMAVPLIELFLLAYSATFTVKDLPLVVFDQSRDSQSRALIASLTNSVYFDLVKVAGSQAETVAAIDSGQAKAGLIVPPDFETDISRGDANVLLLLDGSDSFSLQSAYGAANAVTQNFGLHLTLETLEKGGSLAGSVRLPITTSVQTLYNPVRDDLIFIVPAVAVVILQMFAIVGIAMTLVREREWGIAEQLLSTPIRPLENIVGKVVPYLALTLFEMIVIHLIGYFWFHVPFRGSVLLYLACAVLFMLSSLSLGLFLSTIAATQRQVQMVSSLILIFTFLLTGLVFSRIPMPAWTQAVGVLLPATHFIPIARGVIVKGVGIRAFWGNIGALVLFIVILTLSFQFLTKKRMD
jgi:ABC-2 type transport system permease protein